MTYDEVITMLEEAGLPLAYDHFAEGESPEPPFLVFLYPGTDNMFADDTVYQKIDELNIELYTDAKDPETEARIEDILIAHASALREIGGVDRVGEAVRGLYIKHRL
jgi:hypothetical protein